MTLGDSLRGRAGSIAERMVRQTGTPCELRRPTELEDQADNSASRSWGRIPSEPGPIYATLRALSDGQRRELWGLESRAANSAMVASNVDVANGDLLRPNDGPFLGRVFEVVDRRPCEGVYVSLALVEVPARDEFGFP